MSKGCARVGGVIESETCSEVLERQFDVEYYSFEQSGVVCFIIWQTVQFYTFPEMCQPQKKFSYHSFFGGNAQVCVWVLNGK